MFLSVITLGEIEWGIRAQEQSNPVFAADLQVWRDRTVHLFADRLLPLGEQAVVIWGRLSHDLGHYDADMMIAATAMRHGAVVVTGNAGDFHPTGVRLENPF